MRSARTCIFRTGTQTRFMSTMFRRSSSKRQDIVKMRRGGLRPAPSHLKPETDRFHLYLLCGVLFLSGCSALIFESVWFYLCGLVFGNSVWASNAVLSSFMGGLALGNALASRYGTAVRRYLAAYAVIEVVI